MRVVFFGYAGSSQITFLQLMAKKIAVAQSTSGDVPQSGLDLVEPGWGFGGDGVGTTTYCSMNSQATFGWPLFYFAVSSEVS